jgi:hypothetical protein
MCPYLRAGNIGANPMTGRGINTVRIGDEVKHITELDALTLMHEWSKLTKENADLYDYNRQVNRGARLYSSPDGYPFA